ncbi:hypothetical protein BS47DRAFT_1348205 [Hydnum rufescens UP504]|uniref:Uncharacterized protein n=1 Tax=Hydnum rufescens UP504 TaxID=1448309 RepID=A0A9P6AQR0_9AGAM|nr:hypothetical protein BS47DRAFT_1348205 [Hydnum rufescens UP504]
MGLERIQPPTLDDRDPETCLLPLLALVPQIVIARGGSKTKRGAGVEERLRVALDMEKNGDRRGLIHGFTDIVYNHTGREVNGLIMIPTRIGRRTRMMPSIRVLRSFGYSGVVQSIHIP